MLDNLPIGTLVTLAGIVLAVIGYATGDLTYIEAMAGAGVVGVGGGQIGQARAQSGKGMNK